MEFPPASTTGVVLEQMTTPQMDDFDFSGLQPAARARGGWPEPAKWAVLGGAGCSVIVLLEFLLIWFGVHSVFNATAPEGLTVQMQAPPQGTVGKAITLRLQVRNEGEQPFTVRGLAVRSATRRAFTLADLRPAPTVPKTSLFGTDTWVYSQAVAPGKSWTVQFQATPQRAGKLRGAVEVQVDRGVRQASFTVNVAPAAPGRTGPKPPTSGAKH